MSNSYVRLLTKDGRLLTHAEHSQDWFKTPRPTCRAASRAVSEITQHILLRSSALYLLIKSQIPIKVGLWKHETYQERQVLVWKQHSRSSHFGLQERCFGIDIATDATTMHQKQAFCKVVQNIARAAPQPGRIMLPFIGSGEACPLARAINALCTRTILTCVYTR